MSHAMATDLNRTSLNSNNRSNESVLMNSSIDEFLAEYFGPAYRAEHYGEKADSSGSFPQEVPMGNFDIGGDDLMTSVTEEEATLESLPLSRSALQLRSPDGASNEKKIVNIRTSRSRKSLSYDIIFDEKHAVQIRITDSMNGQTIKEDQLIQEELRVCKLKNSELEKQNEILKQKVQVGDTVIQRLEMELAQIYMKEG